MALLAALASSRRLIHDMGLTASFIAIQLGGYFL
jgi:hypothetical protein